MTPMPALWSQPSARTPVDADGAPLRIEPDDLAARIRAADASPVIGELVDTPAGPMREVTVVHRLSRPDAEAMVHISSLTDRHRTDITAARFEPVAGTGLHHVSYLLPDALVASYAIVEASAIPRDAGRDRPGWLAIHEAGRADPRCRETLPHPHRAPRSVLRLPAASEHPAWRAVRAGVPADASAPRRVAAGHPIHVIDPATAPEHVLVLFDGEVWRRLALAEALAHRTGPALGVVLVESGTARADLLPHPERIAALVEEVVLPVARGEWGAAAGSAIVAGQSYGGLAAASITALRPDLAECAVVQSGSFPFRAGVAPRRDAVEPGDLTRLLRTRSARGRVHLQVGAEEEDLSRQAEMFADAARRAGMRVTGEQRSGGHDYAWWSDALFDGVDAVLG